MNNSPERKLRGTKRGKNGYTPLIIVLIVAIIAVVAGTVTAVIIGTREKDPEITIGADGDVYDYRDALFNLYEQKINEGESGEDAMKAVNDAVNKELDTDRGREYRNQTLLAQMNVYQNASDYAKAISMASKINPDELTIEQKVVYYNILYYSNAKLGNTEDANKYSIIVYDLTDELGGEGA